MNELQKKMYDVFCNMSGDEVIRYITNYLGCQILTDGMANDMVEEGLCENYELGIEEEEEEEEEG